LDEIEKYVGLLEDFNLDEQQIEKLRGFKLIGYSDP